MKSKHLSNRITPSYRTIWECYDDTTTDNDFEQKKTPSPTSRKTPSLISNSSRKKRKNIKKNLFDIQQEMDSLWEFDKEKEEKQKEELMRLQEDFMASW